MVLPKLLQAAEKLSISTSISCSLLALRAQSSAIEENVSENSLLHLRDGLQSPRVKQLSVSLNLMLVPGSHFLKASVSIAENTMLNSVGARTQPCLTPLVTGKASEDSLSSRTRAIMPSWIWRTIAMNVLGQPNFSMIFQSPSRLTVSKALVKSTKVV